MELCEGFLRPRCAPDGRESLVVIGDGLDDGLEKGEHCLCRLRGIQVLNDNILATLEDKGIE